MIPAATEKQKIDDLLSTQEAGKELGINASRVRQLILAGRLPAHKIGKVLVVKRQDLELVKFRPLGANYSKKD